jgi:hypothetical protein
MSRSNLRRLHAGFAVVQGALAVATAIGKPLISPAVSWILLALLSLTWLVTAVIVSPRREPHR